MSTCNWGRTRPLLEYALIDVEGLGLSFDTLCDMRTTAIQFGIVFDRSK